MGKESEIISKYCKNVGMRIRVCRHRDVALLLKKRICNEIKNECKSEIIFVILNKYIDQLIEETFTKNGFNKELEDKK
jgi:hypothetical protein